MSINEFFEELKSIKGFEINNNQGIVKYTKSGKCYCPITAVYYKKFKKYVKLDNWKAAAKELGLNMRSTEAIVNAADNLTKTNKYTKKLIEVLKVKKDLNCEIV